MLNSKGVTIITLIVTIIIIILIAAISAPLLSSVINDAFEKDAKEEVANVENVLAFAKSQILIDEFTPNPANIITEAELLQKFGNVKVLSQEEIDHIIDYNSRDDISNIQKYYLMDQTKFDEELKNGFNIDNIRADREYLVNYYDGTVVANYNGTRMSNVVYGGIKANTIVERGSITVAMTPNGSSGWLRNTHLMDESKKLKVLVEFDYNDGTRTIASIDEIKCIWNTSTSQPDETLFNNASPVSLVDDKFTVAGVEDETGSNWCIWLRIKYTEYQTGRHIVKYVHSSPFFFDNELPTATLSVSPVQ